MFWLHCSSFPAAMVRLCIKTLMACIDFTFIAFIVSSLTSMRRHFLLFSYIQSQLLSVSCLICRSSPVVSSYAIIRFVSRLAVSCPFTHFFLHSLHSSLFPPFSPSPLPHMHTHTQHTHLPGIPSHYSCQGPSLHTCVHGSGYMCGRHCW